APVQALQLPVLKSRLEKLRNRARESKAMDISASQVKELREKTGAGMMDCKKALTETAGDFEKAVEYLRKKGIASAAKKAGRATKEGAVSSFIQGEGRVGGLIG